MVDYFRSISPTSLFIEFEGRRDGIIKALTTDVQAFCEQCELEKKKSKEKICLYGLPSKQWKVRSPFNMDGACPEPTPVNLDREAKELLAPFARYSDAWLLSLSFYCGGIYHFDKACRKRLFKLMNDLPTIYEVVSAEAKKKVKDKSTVSNHRRKKSKPNSKTEGEKKSDCGAFGDSPEEAMEDFFCDFKSRRAGIIKALTTDVQDFYQYCDPGKENLCLYGFADKRWEVKSCKEVLPGLPQPALRINIARVMLEEEDWLALVAVQSYAWLLSVAFNFGAESGFDKACRERLFDMMNDLPTIREEVSAYNLTAASHRTPEDILLEFVGRRDGIIKALTTDVQAFYQQCELEKQKQKEKICLYGFLSKQWEVYSPVDKVPRECPGPTPVNLDIEAEERLAQVARYSDAWLLSLSFYFSGTSRFDKFLRKRLFNLMNDLPTIYEVVSAEAKKKVKDKSTVSNHRRNKSKSNSKTEGKKKSDCGASGGSPEEAMKKYFCDFENRRAGIIKALTTDIQDFYQQCDPEKESLCLYGFADGSWEVKSCEEVLPGLPQPALGINIARDKMEEQVWLALVAVQSHAWLLSVTSNFGAESGFDKARRKRLFNMMNGLPTIYEAVSA